MLDTNIVSDLVRHPHGPIATRIAEGGETRGCTSLIVAAEPRIAPARLNTLAEVAVERRPSFVPERRNALRLLRPTGLRVAAISSPALHQTAPAAHRLRRRPASRARDERTRRCDFAAHPENRTGSSAPAACAPGP